MDSARSYHASKTSVRRFEITDYQAGLTDVSTKGQKTPNGEDTTQNTEEQENTAENTTMTAKDWQSRLLVSSARWDMRSSASEQTLSTIREYTVRYIFDLLFPSRNSTLRDWMQENGWSSGNQTGNSWNTGNSVNNTQTNSGSTQGTATPASDVFNLVTSRVKILNYVSETWNIEQEDTSFSTVGSVRTKDGREINFNVNVNMSRRCEEYYKEQLNVAEFTLHDPLVINLDTDVAEVSDQTFYFDLDADGEEDLLAGALREVREETGVKAPRPVMEDIYSLEVLTVDGHEKHGEYVPSHLHMNVTYLLEADESETLHICRGENSGVAWFSLEEALEVSTEPWFVERIYKKLNEKLKNI